MVDIIQQGENTLYQCPECELRYKEREIAEKCEAWCKKNKSCNLDIIKHAVPKNETGSSE